jgi:hypothetical protein
MANENNNAAPTNQAQKAAKDPMPATPVAEPKQEETPAPAEADKITPAQK